MSGRRITKDELDELRGEPPKDPGFPSDGVGDPACRKWLEWMFSVSRGSHVGEVVRYGAVDGTPMTIEIVPPGDGKPRLVRFAEERDAAKHGTLRTALIRDASLRAEHITNGKSAGDVYCVLCRLARVVGGSDPRAEVDEWLDGYRHEAKRMEFSLAKNDLYATLDALRRYPYSKRQINLWLNAVDRGEVRAEPPRPPLIVDPKGGEWTSITHLATYVRWGRERAGVVNEEKLAGQVVELGGKRWEAKAWDATTRQRRHRIITVLVRFPDVPDGPPDDQVALDV